MYVHPDALLNKFKDVKIPSTQELFILHGFQTPLGHGDNASEVLPANRQGIDNLDRTMIVKRQAEIAASEFEAKAAAQYNPEPHAQEGLETQHDPKPTEAV